ncbi:hypothetical protein ACQKM9_19990 [Viridibacillus sp. NPDC093762]|uniref:hypothetical protein n=1 Tax=Viridibacillus sp. NPDC093762 TaxID=3390720 RepID=UPI003D029E30
MLKKLVFLVFSLGLLLTGCSSTPPKVEGENIESLLNDSELSDYIEKISYEVPEKRNEDKEYEITILINANSDFDKMNLYEKYELMESTVASEENKKELEDEIDKIDNDSNEDNNSADYNSNGEYKPVEDMTQEEIKQELEEMLRSNGIGK